MRRLPRIESLAGAWVISLAKMKFKSEMVSVLRGGSWVQMCHQALRGRGSCHINQDST